MTNSHENTSYYFSPIRLPKILMTPVTANKGKQVSHASRIKCYSVIGN